MLTTYMIDVFRGDVVSWWGCVGRECTTHTAGRPPSVISETECFERREKHRCFGERRWIGSCTWTCQDGGHGRGILYDVHRIHW